MRVLVVIVLLASLPACVPSPAIMQQTEAASGEAGSCSARQLQETPENLNCYANELQRQGKFADAIPFLERAIRLDATYWPAWCTLGASFTNMGEFPKAVEVYNHALSLQPNSSVSLQGRGAAYVGLEQYDKGTSDLDRAIAISPQSLFARYTLGVSYYRQRKFTAAIESFTAAIAVSPNHAPSIYARGAAYKMVGLQRESGDDYSKAKTLDPSLSPYL